MEFLLKTCNCEKMFQAANPVWNCSYWGKKNVKPSPEGVKHLSEGLGANFVFILTVLYIFSTCTNVKAEIICSDTVYFLDSYMPVGLLDWLSVI